MVSEIVTLTKTRTGPPYEPLDIESKTCSNCKRRLPISMYKPDTRREDGWSLWCSDCRNTQRERLEVTRQRGSLNGGRLMRPDRLTKSQDAEISDRISRLSDEEKRRVLLFMVDLLFEREKISA